jgi:transcription antitermination factor NusG
MSLFCSGWYLIYTKPQHEKKVHNRLTEASIHSFLPTKKVLKALGQRKKYMDEPLFPSYVFIYLENMQQYYYGMDVDGALHYVKTGRDIVRVNPTIVDNIKLATGQPDGVETCDNHFQPGHKLVITDGPLTGLACEVVEYNNKHRLLVRVDLLQRNLLLTLPTEHLMSQPAA